MLNKTDKIVQQQDSQLFLPIDDALFASLADLFSAILKEPVQFLRYKGSRQEMIRYKALSGTGLWLKFWQNCCEQNGRSNGTLKIVRLNVVPSGRGLGSRIIRQLLATLAQTPFTRISLTPANQAAAAFWLKAGFCWSEETESSRMVIDISS